MAVVFRYLPQVGLLLIALPACGTAPLEAVVIDPRSLATGLVAHWTFDDGAGVVVKDNSGNGHDGQLTGGTWIEQGQFGGALELAYGDTVTVPNFPQATENWTVSTWIRASEAQLNADTADISTILSTELVFAGGWQLHLDNRSGYQRFDAAYWAGSQANDYVVVYCSCIMSDEWTHLTAVFDYDAETLTLYQGLTAADRVTLPAAILTGDSTLYMGTWNQGERFLAADVDDFAIWSRALSAAEIVAVSQQSFPD
jgi:hypothetical protein